MKIRVSASKTKVLLTCLQHFCHPPALQPQAIALHWRSHKCCVQSKIPKAKRQVLTGKSWWVGKNVIRFQTIMRGRIIKHSDVTSSVILATLYLLFDISGTTLFCAVLHEGPLEIHGHRGCCKKFNKLHVLPARVHYLPSSIFQEALIQCNRRDSSLLSSNRSLLM